jgi:hypothetical protein
MVSREGMTTSSADLNPMPPIVAEAIASVGSVFRKFKRCLYGRRFFHP